MKDIGTLFDSLSEGVEILQKSLQCAICLELLKNPVCTRCSHSFCRECIMTVVNTKRIAHCPLCNKSINRRSITDDEKIGELVKKVQNVIDGIGKDTGFDITSHTKLPSSTREAFFASPKCMDKKQDAITLQNKAPRNKISKPTVIPSKEEWLKRYDKQYPGRHSNGESNLDFLSISQVEPTWPTYMTGDKRENIAKSRVDQMKIPRVEKVEEWLQKNNELDNMEEECAQSPLTVTPDSQQHPHTMIVTADVHKDLEDDPDLVSISQVQPRFYVAPRKVGLEALRSCSDDFIPSDNKKIICSGKVGKGNSSQLIQVVNECPKAENSEGGPYEFVSSQKSYKEVKKKRSTKRKYSDKKTEIKGFKMYNLPFKKDNKQITAIKDTISAVKRSESPNESEFTFICPVDVNDTFDHFVANTRKSEQAKSEKPLDMHKSEPSEVEKSTKLDKEDDDDIFLFRTPLDEIPMICQKNGSTKLDTHKSELCKIEKSTKLDKEDDIFLFRTPLDDIPMICQKNDSTTESMSDVDFSSGSDEEWGKSNQVNLQSKQAVGRRTRSASVGKQLAKNTNTKGKSEQRTRSKSGETYHKHRKSSKREKELQDKEFDALKGDFEEIKDHKLQIASPVKKTPLSPVKKGNLNINSNNSITNNVEQNVTVSNNLSTKTLDKVVEKTLVSTDKAHINKENLSCPLAEMIVEAEKLPLQTSTVNTSACSRSPGWSRISQTKKDFEKFKKPALKALNVSGGEACFPKKHANEVTKKRNVTETPSPVPTIDDSDSAVDISGAGPVVAFHSPEAMNRASLMSRLVMDLESQIGPNSSIADTSKISAEPKTPRSLAQKHLKITALQKCTSFDSSVFSEPANESPKTVQRKEQINDILSSLENQDERGCQSNENNESGIGMLTESDRVVHSIQNKEDDNMKCLGVQACKKNIVILESDSTLALDEVTEYIKNTKGNSEIEQNKGDNAKINEAHESSVGSKEHGHSDMSTEALPGQPNVCEDKENMSRNLLKLESESVSTATQNVQSCMLSVDSKECTQDNQKTISISSKKTAEVDVPKSGLKTHEDFMAKGSLKTNSCAEQSISDHAILTNSQVMATKNEIFQEKIQAVHSVASNLNNIFCRKTYVPFIKFGRLKPSKKVSRFICLGPLAPHRKRTFSRIGGYVSANFRVLSDIQRSVTDKSNEVGIQTSPKLIHSLHHDSNTVDAQIQVTPTVNKNCVRFYAPECNIDPEVNTENYVPNSCSDIDMYPSAIPLPHYAVLKQSTTDSVKHDSENSSVCETAKPLHINSRLIDEEVDPLLEDDTEMNQTVVLPNSSEYSKPIGSYNDCEIPISQLSTATTIKISQLRVTKKESQDQNISPKLPLNSATNSQLSVSLLNNSLAENINVGVHDQSCIHQETKKMPDVNVCSIDNQMKCMETNEEKEMFESGEYMIEKKSIKDKICKPNKQIPNDSNVTVDKNIRRSSRVSRQLKFSPNVVPKLSDPRLDKSVDNEKRTIEVQKKYKRIRVSNDSSDSECADNESRDRSESELRESKKPCRTSLKSVSEQNKNNEMPMKIETAIDDTEVIDLLTPPEDAASEDVIPGTYDKAPHKENWLEEDVPDSEELMARVMANIEADLAETRKRKMKEKLKRESPTMFTPPVAAESEEQDSKMTCELVASEQPEVQLEKKPVRESSIGNTTMATDSESLCTQQRNEIQAGIHTLEAEIKECKAALQRAVQNKPVGVSQSKTTCADSGSEDDVVEPTPRKENITNKTWDSKNVEEGRMDCKDISVDQHTVILKQSIQNIDKSNAVPSTDSACNLPSRNPADAMNAAEMQSKPEDLVKQSAPVSLESLMTSPETSKQFVLRVPQKKTPSPSPVRKKDTLAKEDIVSKQESNSVLRKLSSTEGVQKQTSSAAGITPLSRPSVGVLASVQTPTPGTVQAVPFTKLCFVCSGLPMGLIARVKALARMLGAEFSNKFESYTTHLVVKASDDMMADKTFKYLSAIVKRKWIVSFAWVNACLQARKLLPEDEYEMLDSSGENGPHRSRISSDPLFENFEFCCIEPFTDLMKDQLEEMLRECGAETVNNPEKFSFKPGHHCMILVQMDAEREDECKEWWEKYGVLPIAHEWVFECIGRYRIVPIWSFLMCPISEDHIKALGYPEDALASDDETEVESEAC